MLTRILGASALIAIAGATTQAQQASSNAGVFGWVAADDDSQNARSITVERDNDTVLVFAPSAKGGTRVSFSDGTNVIELRLEGDRVHDLEVIRDGQVVSGSNARVDGDRIVVLSPSGERIARFNRPSDDGAKHEITWHAQAQQPRRAVARERAAFAERAAPPADATITLRPRRVIGISASSPSEALAAQLGVEVDKVIVVDSVSEGLPAAKAGLRRFDVITKIDGAPPATLERLREVIGSKGDDGVVRVTVRRGGQEETLELRPTSVNTVEREEQVAVEGFPFRQFWIEDADPEVRAQVEAALANAREALAAQQDRFQELQVQLSEQAEQVVAQLQRQLRDSDVANEVRRAYEEAIRELNQANVREQIERAMVEVQRAMENVDVQRELRSLPRIEFLERNNDGSAVIVAPTPPSAPGAPGAPGAPRLGMRATSPDDARLKALEERMERIERLLERIAEGR